MQVVALRDYREARSASDQLAGLGFPAYTEFAMNDGQQYVRVRVGCFTTRDAAEAMATAMRGHVTADAQAVELTPGAAVTGCTEESVGFLSGYEWELVDAGGAVAFGVRVSGVEATVAFDGERWHVVQRGDELPSLSPAAGSGRVSVQRVGGSAFVSVGGVVVCPGELLDSAGAAAVVERGAVVVACRLLPEVPL